jgi:hypothetical protein
MAAGAVAFMSQRGRIVSPSVRHLQEPSDLTAIAAMIGGNGTIPARFVRALIGVAAMIGGNGTLPARFAHALIGRACSMVD